MSNRTNLIPPLWQRVANWTAKTTTAAADYLMLFDSAAGGFGKKILVSDFAAGAAGAAAAVRVTAGAGAVTAAAAQAGAIRTNTGASGTVTVTLPAAVPGMEIKALVKAAFELRLDPNGTETIALPSTGVQGGAGKYLTADAVGESVHLICTVAGTWDSFGAVDGTWTAEP